MPEAKLKEYDFKGKVGKVLIVNNDEFRDLPERSGSKEDGDRLVDLFQNDLKFEKSDKLPEIQIFNQTKDQILKAVKEFVEDDFADFSCSVFILMSHGKESVFSDVNGDEIEIKRILDLFRESNQLRGKPKLFFFQVCRGKGEAGAIASDSDSSKKSSHLPVVQSDMIDESSMPNSADFFIGYSSSFGDQSFRYLGSVYGSWYMLCLVRAIKERYRSHDVAEIHCMVNRMVSKYHKSMSTLKQKIKEMQAPQFVSSLRRRFYLSNCLPK